MQLQPGAFIEHYEIIRPLGEGGMGQVFLARDTRLGRLVAIKILTFGADGLTNAQFLSEARATARCRHENIVIIYEADEFDSVPYMVLEYVDGRTLRAWMDEHTTPTNAPAKHEIGDPCNAVRKRTSPAMCIELMLPVARALVSAHALGIVHRDLKPENILVSQDGPIKVVDFGIAGWLDDDERGRNGIEEFGEATGTLPYMAPESLLHDGADHRVDIWAFGVILFELALGRHPLAPFSMHKLPELMDLDSPMPSARELAPELGQLATLIDRCLDKQKEKRIAATDELVTELSSLRTGMTESQLLDSTNPFAGLMAFQEVDRAKFFGRDRDIASLISRLRFQPLVAVGGPSGAGKSSFVRAGLLPAYKRLGEKRESIVLRPGKKPLLALASTLVDLAEHTRTDLHQSSFDVMAGPEAMAGVLRERPGLLGAILRASCRARGPQSGTLLFVDQFEELFTLCSDPAERTAFLSCLEGAADDATSPLRVVLAMRSDFLDRMADDRKLSTDLAKSLFLLPPLGKEGLREALTKPVELLGYRYESEDLVERMLGALGRTNAPLPLLQFTASKLWEARDTQKRLLTASSYEKLGGVEGTLATHADTVVSSMPVRDKELARRFFERLVTPERTRAIVSESDLGELAADPVDAERVLSRLVDARLLMAEKDESTGGVAVEIVHESLIARWPMLSRWLDENKEDADFLARLRVAARQWRESGKARGLLWREEAMLEARRFRERSRVELSRTEKEFLEAVFSLGELAVRRKRYVVLAIVAASFFVAVGMGTLAWKERQANEEATAQAARTRELAERTRLEASRARDAARVASAREHESDPTFALSLLREVEQPNDLHVFPGLAARAARTIVAESVLPGHDGQVWTAEISPDGRYALTTAQDWAYVWDIRGSSWPRILKGHTAPVWRATYSPDGRKILTASWDKTARIWPAEGGDPVILQHTARVSWAAWSPNGQRVVTTGWDPAAHVFAADGSGEPLALRGHTERLRRASFSPDGRRIVSASYDHTARVWQLDGAAPPVVLSGHAGAVFDAVFSSDGTRVATISEDRTARIFSSDGAGESKVFKGHGRKLNSIAWSPDGRRIVTTSDDETARIWQADDETAPPVVLEHRRDVRMATFSPDGKFVLTASSDNIARLWTVGSLDTMTEFSGHGLGVEYANFSSDGRHFITTSGDGSARIWSADQKNAPRVFRGKMDTFPDVDISPDGKSMLLTWPIENKVRIWDINGLAPPRYLFGSSSGFVQAAWTADGKRVLLASEDGSSRLWNANLEGEPIVFPSPSTMAERGVFSPDGTRVAITYQDGSARVFPTDGSGNPILAAGSGNRIVDIDFDRAGSRLLTLRKDETAVHIWDLEAGTSKSIEGHSNDLFGFQLSPDRTRMLTVSADNTARIYPLEHSDEPVVLRGHTNKVVDGDFSPDGEKVVTASADGTLRVWKANGTGESMILRGFQDPPRHVRWSPDGSRIAAASERTIYVFAANGQGVPLVLEGHTNRIHQLHWGPDATFLASSSTDGTVRIWRNVQKIPTLDELLKELWRASTYCLSMNDRREILGLAEDVARQGRAVCLKRGGSIGEL